MSVFEDLGIRVELVAAAAAAGFDTPVALQRAAVPVLRRGGNAVLIGSSGSGATVAWSIALLDRLAGVPTPAQADDAVLTPGALVVTTSEERASRLARTLVRLAGTLPVPIRALASAWSGRGPSGIVVAPLGAAARSLAESTLKLAGIGTVVLDNLNALLDSPDASGLADIMAAVPAEAQRILVTPAWTRTVEHIAEAHARRAVTIPPRPADPDLVSPPDDGGSISYIVAAAPEKADALARVLRRKRGTTPLIVTRSETRARELAAELVARGFTDEDAQVVPAARSTDALIAADVPFDAAALANIDKHDGLVIIEPAELGHLRAIAGAAGRTLQSIGTRPARTSAARFREQVRAAIHERDLDANLALLEPLFDEYSAAEIAAALSALLRERRSTEAEVPPVEERKDRPQPFVRLFVSAGTRDNIRPADLVGVITGEASITGDQVGRIELRDTFSVVEVAANAADRVIRALNGTTMRGRSLRVDYDRKGAPTKPRTGSRPRA